MATVRNMELVITSIVGLLSLHGYKRLCLTNSEEKL